MTRPLVVKVTCGTDDGERANQGLTVAATAVAAGVSVSVWLTGEAAWFALPGRADNVRISGATPMSELLGVVLAGGRVTVCTQCAERRGIGAHAVLPGIRVAGSSTYVEEILADDVQAVVY